MAEANIDRAIKTGQLSEGVYTLRNALAPGGLIAAYVTVIESAPAVGAGAGVPEQPTSRREYWDLVIDPDGDGAGGNAANATHVKFVAPTLAANSVQYFFVLEQTNVNNWRMSHPPLPPPVTLPPPGYSTANLKVRRWIHSACGLKEVLIP